MDVGGLRQGGGVDFDHGAKDDELNSGTQGCKPGKESDVEALVDYAVKACAGMRDGGLICGVMQRTGGGARKVGHVN